ncbi:MAG: penicillin-binding protein activator LpoB [bacterium]|nr:penicillin-binding protein activator LpoB [bacterium]
MLRVPFRSSFSARASHGALRLGLLLVIAFAVGCGGTTVTRTAVEEEIDLSGLWNDVDSQKVSEEMITDSLSRYWIEDWRDRTGQRPTVIVGAVRNKSSEHINTRTFTKDLERAFVNSGRVRVVADSGEREGLRTERLDQLRNATIETAKSMGKEIGADFMLIGGINTIIDAADNKQVRFYQVELELIALETNEKVWIGQHKLKKLVKNPKYRL